jgi:Sec-independent protein translocase protein TatA
MKYVAVLVLVLVAVVAVGRMQALPTPGKSAGQTEKRIRDVAEVLEAAAAKADDAQAVKAGLQPTKAEARWAAARNAACAERADGAARLARPRSVDGIAEFARRWLVLDDAHDRRAARLRPPGSYAAGARRLARLEEKQERGLRRVIAAAGRGDVSATLAEVRSLQKLAASANPIAAELGLTNCFFPVAGLPY